MENAGTVRYVITADNERFMEQLAAAGKALLAFADQIDEVDSQVNNLGSRQTLQSANSFTSSISQTAKELGHFTQALGNVGWNAFTTAAGIASGTLVKFASGAVTDTQFLENTQIQMQGLTHSIEDGNKAMAMATQYFKNNPFNRFDVTDATKQLIQYGATLDDIPSLLDKMGKVSLSTGVEINTLSRIYQSAMSNGRISTGDINLLAERGIPIWKALQDVTGKTNADIRKDLESGKLAIQDFQKAFDLLVDDNAMEQFNNTFSRQLDRFKGRLSNMRAAIAGYTMDMEKGLQVDPSGLYRSVTEVLKVFANTFDYGVGKQFLESLTRLGNSLAWVIDKVMGFYEITVKASDGTEKVVKMSKTLDTFFSGLGKAIDFLTNNMELMLPIGIGALSMFGGLLSKIPVFGQILGPIGNSANQLTKAFNRLNPVLKILVGILGLGAFEALRKGELTEPLQKIIKSVSKIGETLTPVVKRLKDIFSVIGEKIVVTSLNSIASILEVLANVLSSIPTETLVKLTEGILAMVAIKKVSQPLGDFLTKMNQVKGVITSIFHGGAEGSSILGQFKKVFGKDAELGSITDTIKNTGNLGDSVQIAAQKLANTKQNIANMRENLKNVAILVAIIGELGLAIGIADRMIVSDFGTLMGKLGAMAIAIVGMGAIAKLADKVKVSKESMTTLAGLAADIGAVGFALGVADRMIISDFGTLASKLGAMGIAIIEMGALAKLADKVKITGKGILVLAGIALDIAAVGAALGVADRMIQSDFKTLMEKLGAMGLAVLEFGVLAGIIGAVMATGIGAVIVGAGIATILGFAAAIASIALSIGEIDKNVPSDIEPIIKKIELIGECLNAMSTQTWVNPIKNFVKLIDISVLAGVASIYAHVGKVLVELEKISLNKNKIKTKVELITECLRIISNDRGDESIIKMFKTTISQFLGAVDVNTLSGVVDVYLKIAKSLNELQKIELRVRTISEKVIFIRDTIAFIASSKEDSIGMAISTTVREFLNNVDLHIVEELVSIYNSIAWKLNEIQTIKLNSKEIGNKIVFIKQTIDYVTDTGTGSVFESLLKAKQDEAYQNSVQTAKDILEIFSQLSDTLSKIKDISIDEDTETTIKDNIGILQRIVGTVLGQNGGGGLAGLIRNLAYGGSITPEDVEKAVSIIENFSKLDDAIVTFSTSRKLVSVDTSILVERINKTIEHIANIRPIPSIDSKVKTIEGSKKIFDAMNEIASTAESLKDVGDENGEVRQKLYHIRDFVAQVGMIWEAPEIENKDKVVHITQSILYSMSEMATAAIEAQDVNKETSDKIIRIRDLVAQVGMIWEAPNIENKDLVVQSSKNIIENMKGFAEVANQIPALAEDKTGIIDSIKTSIQNLGGLPEGDYSIKLETVKAAREIVNELVGISNSMAGLNQEGINNGLLGNLITVISSELQKLANTLNVSAQDFYKIGTLIADNLTSGFNDAQLQSQLSETVDLAINALSNKTESFTNLGNSYGDSILNSFKSKNWTIEGSNVGKAIAQGFAEGITNEMWRINLAVGVLSNTAIIKMKQLLGIASPSKVMYEIGAYTGQGLIEGILSTEDQLKNAMSTMISDIQNPLDSISSESLNLAGLDGQGNGLRSSSNNLTMNNNIYTQFDIDQMSRDIMWNMERY